MIGSRSGMVFSKIFEKKPASSRTETNPKKIPYRKPIDLFKPKLIAIEVQAILFGPGVKVVIKTKGIRETKSMLSISAHNFWNCYAYYSKEVAMSIVNYFLENNILLEIY